MAHTGGGVSKLEPGQGAEETEEQQLGARPPHRGRRIRGFTRTSAALRSDGETTPEEEAKREEEMEEEEQEKALEKEPE